MRALVSEPVGGPGAGGGVVDLRAAEHTVAVLSAGNEHLATLQERRGSMYRATAREPVVDQGCRERQLRDRVRRGIGLSRATRPTP
jgi:hypothetical protein